MAERFVAIYIINAAWMTCIVTGVATLLAISVKRVPPGHLHRVWVAALACASLVPLATVHNAFDEDRSVAVGLRLAEWGGPLSGDAVAWPQILTRRRPPTVPLTPIQVRVLSAL